MPQQSKRAKKFSNSRLILIALIVLAVLVLAFFILRSPKKTVTTIPSSNPASVSKPSSSTATTQQPASSPKATAVPGSGTPSSAGPLQTPYGSFVSNHSPGQNGSGTSESSTCITTPGATCYIQLTMGNETKLLQTTTTDSTGTAYWNWDVSNPKLSSGSWTVTAVAALNGATKSAQDPQPLVIQ